MCNKYYSAITSSFERITHEFHVSFVIITWYVGSVIGSFVAIHLHAINLLRCELVLLAAGFSFLSIVYLLIETHLYTDERFLLRILLGSLIGIIYLTSVIGRLQINLSAFTCFFSLATIILITQTETSSEIFSVSLILVYNLIALNVSCSNYLFLENDSKHVVTGVRFGAINTIVKEMKPLIYLAPAKLLTTFCYFLPFVRIFSQILVHPCVLHADVKETLTNEIFNDFVVLFLSRLALGTITILIVRHNVNYLSIIYVMFYATLLAAVIFIPFFDLKQCTFVFCTIIIVYFAFSLTHDVICHRIVINTDLDLNFIPKVLSLTFATFNEHLFDVLFSVIYLNDLINVKIIVTSLAIILLTLLTTYFERYKRITTKKQIL